MKSRLGNAAQQWRIPWARKLDKITDLRSDTATLPVRWSATRRQPVPGSRRRRWDD